MRTWQNILTAFVLASAFAGAAGAQQAQPVDQTQPQQAGPVTTVNQAIDRIIAREHDENAMIRRYNPIVETYIQDMKPDPQMGNVPVKDHYFLGQAQLSQGVVDDNMLGNKARRKIDQFNPLAHVA